MNSDDMQVSFEYINDDSKSFQEAYDRYSGPLLRFIFRFTETKEGAEEVLHDVFIELLSGKFQHGENSNLKSWLFTIAKNKSINYRRKNSKEISSNLIVSEAESQLNLEQQTIDCDLLKKLTITQDSLSVELKQTWDLRRQGLDYQQIASSLQIPIGTVKSRFHRIVELLRKEFVNNEK